MSLKRLLLALALFALPAMAQVPPGGYGPSTGGGSSGGGSTTTVVTTPQGNGVPRTGQVSFNAANLTQIYASGQFDAFPGITTYGPNNSYLVVTFMHSAQGDPNTDGVLEYITSLDGGQTWSTPATIFSATGGFHEQDTNITTLRRDGSLLITGMIELAGAPTQGQCYAIRGTATGSIITWGSPTFLGPAFPSTPNGNGFCTDKALELQNGNLLLSVYARQNGGTTYSAGVYTGTFSGSVLTWSNAATLIAAGTAAEQYDEIGLTQSPNGTILAIIRHDVSATTKGYSQSTSTNNGATWSGLSQTLTCSTTAPFCGRPSMGMFPNGKIVLSTTTGSAGYFPNFWTSDDGGNTWTSAIQYSALFDEYSSMTFIGNGTMANVVSLATVASTTASININFFYDGSGGGGGAVKQIQRQVVAGSSTSTITFSNIPGVYSKLILDYVASDSTASTVQGITCLFNGDTTAGHYAGFNWQGGASGNGLASASTGTANGIGCGAIPGASAPANTQGSVEITILNYANTSVAKNFLATGITQSTANTFGSLIMTNYVEQWNQTAAINSITLTDGSGGNLVAGSTFTLYGVL